ncbi:unnamed protein product [Coregonus sp. 'balchen']|nr:unnamed protein product [Coregonus sp. 'balchen']
MMTLWHSLSQLDNSIQEVTGGMRMVFTATMSPKSHCFGPFTSNVLIPYTEISLNHDNGYNPALGVFMALRMGLYFFSCTAYSHVGAAGQRLYHKLQLMRNGEVVVSTWEDNQEDSEDSGSQTILVLLDRGSQMLSERQLCGG